MGQHGPGFPSLKNARAPVSPASGSCLCGLTGKYAPPLTYSRIAIAWAAVFVAVSGSLTTGVTVGAGVLLVPYPLIDAAATLIDARSALSAA